MARGWESKSVEDQIEDKKARRPDPSSAKSPEELEHERRLSSLNLSRSRLLQQLETARNPAHRQMLLNGLSAVEREIEEVSASPR